MKNKILLVVIILMLPFSIYSIKKDNHKESIKVLLNYKNQELNLDLNDYLIGVLGAEMPASFNMEALKAQAIAARSFVLYDMNDYVVNTTIESQGYLDELDLKDKWQDEYDTYYSKIKDAVLKTDNLVMTYDNKIIKSYYYAISNGLTENAMVVFHEEIPYLNIVDSSFDKDVKNYEKTVTFTKEDFCNKLNIDCNSISIEKVIKDESNRVKTISINNKEFDGIEIRKLLGLRSTDFNIDISNDINITTKGYGHGVGMSQYGANYLANNNYNYEEILKYYYNDIEIKKIEV